MRRSAGAYFDYADSMAAQTNGTDIPHVLAAVAQRYVGEHPPHPPVYRVTRTSATCKQDDHRYVFPLSRLFPGMTEGQRVYAWAKLWIEQPQEFIFLLRCCGPARLYHNGQLRFGSSPEEEGAEQAPLKLKLALTQGWNHVVLELGKRPGGGCGAEFGTGNRKNKPFHFLAPSPEREGEEGWIYTGPLDSPLAHIPGAGHTEASTGVAWKPEISPPEDGSPGRMERLYGHRPGWSAYAWSSVVNRTTAARRVCLKGTAYGPLRLLGNGQVIHAASQPGEFSVELEVLPGRTDLFVQAVCAEDGAEPGWGLSIDRLPDGTELCAPRLIHGYDRPWLCLGPFPPGTSVNPAEYTGMDRVAESGEGELVYWTTDEPRAHVRPFLENELFGRWNYPLGVTLNGLLETSRLLQRSDLADYAASHVEFATSTYAYSLWDRHRFGAAGLNNQLSHIDSLDDCGSFGALAIMADRFRPLKGVREASDDIARYIMETQDRMPDGALYRRVGVSPSMHNTMWCDDMYMSVPFLCRYAEMTGESRYMDEAARQLLLYKAYLYMPEKQIMSHVYDVAAGKPSLTAWGRGNGWVFFSLAVLLGVLPQEHPSRAAVLDFYRELAEGYRRLQGSHGLWHQVLTDPESYEESSCTSMFMYGFALGVRHGWLEQPGPYAEAALGGWQGLCERAIDKRGNLYGVCKGSNWSYSHSYYKHDLGWNLNDTHGIGIVLLAGIEVQRMKERLETEG
ncbi:glycoside hydrolase family 88/105 protein [Paenibacillus puerhi]|uniref:glycoside hydrolase family 88/105 protein n=1 Tax=Paenibacillus puerhi TaxID=2692622 RepID=UPI00135C4506|nr:glycoside hydrolase family 88 protein [Paenibacillus puerhi]